MLSCRFLAVSKAIKLELFSWKTTSHKDNIEVCLPNSQLLSGLIGMWSPMKITLAAKLLKAFWSKELLVLLINRNKNY